MPDSPRLFLGCGSFALQSWRDDRLQKWHHGAKFRAKLFDRMLLLPLPRGQEARATLLVFLDPGLGKGAVADFGENPAHLLARLFGDDAWPGPIIALLGGVADGVAHVAQATAIDQIDDELEFVETLEIRNLWLITGFRERLEASFDQFTYTTAQNCLFTEEICFGLFGKRSFQNAGASA